MGEQDNRRGGIGHGLGFELLVVAAVLAVGVIPLLLLLEWAGLELGGWFVYAGLGAAVLAVALLLLSIPRRYR